LIDVLRSMTGGSFYSMPMLSTFGFTFHRHFERVSAMAERRQNDAFDEGLEYRSWKACWGIERKVESGNQGFEIEE